MGPPWKEGEIRLEVDKSGFGARSMKPNKGTAERWAEIELFSKGDEYCILTAEFGEIFPF